MEESAVIPKEVTNMLEIPTRIDNPERSYSEQLISSNASHVEDVKAKINFRKLINQGNINVEAWSQRKVKRNLKHFIAKWDDANLLSKIDQTNNALLLPYNNLP